MEQLCQKYGGLNFNSVRSINPPANSAWGYTYKEYSCNGMGSMKVSEEPKNQKPFTPPIESKVNTNINQKNQMNEAKQKCGDLGFQVNTESFGKCVLQLSK